MVNIEAEIPSAYDPFSEAKDESGKHKVHITRAAEERQEMLDKEFSYDRK
ncbi:hypothetical protein OROMI_019690 [Orobanche minor]